MMAHVVRGDGFGCVCGGACECDTGSLVEPLELLAATLEQTARALDLAVATLRLYRETHEDNKNE